MEVEDPIRVVYDASYPLLVAQLLAICGNHLEAEEVVQEAFIAAMTHPREFLEVANKEAWLRTTAINVMRNRWRRARVFGRLVPRLRQQVAFDVGPDATADHVAIVAALAQLSPSIRETVVLYYLVDLPIVRVAQEQDIPVGTVKARLARARAQLAGLLEEREDDRV